MRIDILSYIRQLLLPQWRETTNIGFAQVLFQPLQYVLNEVDKYERETIYRAGLTGQKLILEHYLQQAVHPLIRVQNQDGLKWDFAIIIPQTLSDENRIIVRDLVDAYKLAGKRYEIRTAFAVAGGGADNTGLAWYPGFPVYSNGVIGWAINKEGSFLTRIKKKDSNTYLVNENRGYLVGQVLTLAAPVGDYDIQVDKLNYALYVGIAEYSLSIASVGKIPGEANGAWKINLGESVRGLKDFTIQWYKGASTSPISTFSVPNLDTNIVDYLYFNPRSEEPWHILSNGAGTYRVKVSTVVGGVTYSDEETVVFTASDLGISTTSRIDLNRVYKVGLLLYPHSWAAFNVDKVKAAADGFKTAGLDTMQLTMPPFLAKKYDTGAESWTAYDEMVDYICNVKGLFLIPKLDAGFSAFALNNGKADGSSILSEWSPYLIFNPADSGEVLGPKHDLAMPPMELFMDYVESFGNRYQSYFDSGKILWASGGLDDNQEMQYPFKNATYPSDETYVQRTLELGAIAKEFVSRLGWENGAGFDVGGACDNLAVGARNVLAMRYLSDGFLAVRGGNDLPWEDTYGVGGMEFGDNFVLGMTSENNQLAVSEWTRTGSTYTVERMTAAVAASINRGVAAINFSFFDSAAGYADLKAIREALEAQGIWNKARVTPQFQGRLNYTLEQARVGGSIMNGPIRTAYNSLKSANGKPPRVDIGFVDNSNDDDGVDPVGPQPDMVNNASIEYISDYINITIRAKLADANGTYNVAIKDGSTTIATRNANYGSQYIEFSFPTYNGATDLRGRQLSFVFTKSGVTQTIEYFLPEMVFREYTPNYSGNADDRIFIPRLTKTFDGRYKIADIGENRGMKVEYYIDGGNGGDSSVLPDINYPVEERTEIMKNLFPTSGERWQVGGNYAISASVFWIKVRPLSL